jgi:hypothetical protein
MRLHHPQIMEGDKLVSLDSGQICLQTEGAECFFRNVEITPISAVPPEYAER